MKPLILTRATWGLPAVEDYPCRRGHRHGAERRGDPAITANQPAQTRKLSAAVGGGRQQIGFSDKIVAPAGVDSSGGTLSSF